MNVSANLWMELKFERNPTQRPPPFQIRRTFLLDPFRHSFHLSSQLRIPLNTKAKYLFEFELALPIPLKLKLSRSSFGIHPIEVPSDAEAERD